jgi:hypothetical protein
VVGAQSRPFTEIPYEHNIQDGSNSTMKIGGCKLELKLSLVGRMHARMESWHAMCT